MVKPLTASPAVDKVLKTRFLKVAGAMAISDEDQKAEQRFEEQVEDCHSGKGEFRRHGILKNFFTIKKRSECKTVNFSLCKI